MLSIGIDPSLTALGWACVDTSAEGRERLVGKGFFTTSSEQLFLDRYESHERSVSDLLRGYGEVRHVGIESSIFDAEFSEGAYALHVLLMRVMRDLEKSVVLFTPMQLKALARGWMGGVVLTKEDMKALARKLLARRGEVQVRVSMTNDEADALLAGWFGGRFFSFLDGELGVDELTDSERYVFTHEHRTTRGEVRKIGLVHRSNDRFFRFFREVKA